MATNKAPEKKAAAPVAAKTSTAPAKKAAAKKMTKAELVRFVADTMELTTQQVTAFFDLLASTLNGSSGDQEEW